MVGHEAARFSGSGDGELNDTMLDVTPIAGRTAPSPPLPRPRGALSAAVIDALTGPSGEVHLGQVAVADPLADDDLQLALYVCYELHYRSFAGVDENWEWNPALLDARARLEEAFESALADHVRRESVRPREVELTLRRL
ncbi:MAG: hypothetical protein QOJ31_1192, partial [Gaiellales bacterium]|nr:hypothetical protein [Gaiellales bacterium]